MFSYSNRMAYSYQPHRIESHETCSPPGVNFRPISTGLLYAEYKFTFAHKTRHWSRKSHLPVFGVIPIGRDIIRETLSTIEKIGSRFIQPLRVDRFKFTTCWQSPILLEQTHDEFKRQDCHNWCGRVRIVSSISAR